MTEESFYTRQKNPETESQIGRITARIRDELLRMNTAPEIESVFLGGSYGKSEGGAFYDIPRRRWIYGDFDFFVISKKTSFLQKLRMESELEALERRWTKKLNVRVSFSHPRTLESLRLLTHTLMVQDLKAGFHTILGNPNALESIPALPGNKIPASEAFRLLAGRGIGLLDAERREINKETSDIEALASYRPVIKCILGCGDACLLSQGEYCYRAEDRLPRLRELLNKGNAAYMDTENFVALYEKTLQFKFAPGYILPVALRMEKELARDTWKATFFILVSRFTGKNIFSGKKSFDLLAKGEKEIYSDSFASSLFSNLLHWNELTRAHLTYPPRLNVIIELARTLCDDRSATDPEFAAERYKSLTRVWERYFLKTRKF